MDITKKIFLPEDDIRSIIKDYLTKKGYNIIGDLELNSRSKNDMPKGAYGDLISFEALVEEYEDDLLKVEDQLETKELIISAICGTEFKTMQYAIDMTDKGYAKFTGNQHNESWAWKRDELQKLNIEDLKSLYLESSTKVNQ